MAEMQSEETVETRASDGISTETNELLRALLAVTGRVAFPEEQLRSLVSPTGNPAYLLAYRRCDGATSVRLIAKELTLDHSNLAKAVTKWVEAGVAFRIGRKRLPLHLYALPFEVARLVPAMAERVAARRRRRETEASTETRTASSPTPMDSEVASGLGPPPSAEI